MPKELPDPPLLLVTDRRQANQPLVDAVAAALTAGCRWLSIREKDLSKVEQHALAERILPLATEHGAKLTVHGDLAVAARAGLAGVHLPAHGDAAAARAVLGPSALIGISVHTPAEAARLDPLVLDYAVAGPAFETESKPGYGPALGPAGIAAIVGATPVPVIAIGGIAAETIPAIRDAGALGIAVMGGVMRADDPGAAVRRLVAAWDAAGQPRPR